MSGNGSTTLNNKYKPGGGGIGASSVAIRRAKNRLSTVCDGQTKCGAFYNKLGLYARNPNGYVPYSPRPSAPTLNALTPSNAQLTLNFTLGSDGGSPITDIEYLINNGSPSAWISSGQTTSPVVVTGLINGTSYQVAIRAKNAAGPGPSSNTLLGTPIATAPSAPTLNALTPTDKHLILNFTLGADGGSPITDIEYLINNTLPWISSNKTTSPVVITDLNNDTTYQVAVRANNAVGPGPSSNTLLGIPNPVITTYSAVQTTTWTAPAGVTSVEYLVVGGGGGSGCGYDNGGGGGGGGGMVLTGSLSVTPETSYNVIVGDGGAGGIANRLVSPYETIGTAGNNSVFGSIVALGGGVGYYSRFDGKNNSAGGINVSGAIASTGGNGGGDTGDSNGAGGGGGGNASNGSDGITNIGGNGGAGVSNSISGTPVTYGAGGRGADGGVTIGNAGTAGAATTGNGARGGGAIASSQNNGAKGGSGIVIIKF